MGPVKGRRGRLAQRVFSGPPLRRRRVDDENDGGGGGRKWAVGRGGNRPPRGAPRQQSTPRARGGAGEGYEAGASRYGPAASRLASPRPMVAASIRGRGPGTKKRRVFLDEHCDGGKNGEPSLVGTWSSKKKNLTERHFLHGSIRTEENTPDVTGVTSSCPRQIRRRVRPRPCPAGSVSFLPQGLFIFTIYFWALGVTRRGLSTGLPHKGGPPVGGRPAAMGVLSPGDEATCRAS